MSKYCLYELKESNFYYVQLIDNINKSSNKEYEDLILLNKRHKLSHKQYLSIIYIDEKPLFHLYLIQKLLPLLTISSTTNIWIDIINNTNLENIIEFQQSSILSHIFQHTTLNSFLII